MPDCQSLVRFINIINCNIISQVFIFLLIRIRFWLIPLWHCATHGVFDWKSWSAVRCPHHSSSFAEGSRRVAAGHIRAARLLPSAIGLTRLIARFLRVITAVPRGTDKTLCLDVSLSLSLSLVCLWSEAHTNDDSHTSALVQCCHFHPCFLFYYYLLMGWLRYKWWTSRTC